MASDGNEFPRYPIPTGMPVWQDAFKTVLYDHLQTAMIIEMYTIPMYLFAAYSIKDDGNSGAKSRIIGIARDEMLHLGLAGNILCSIGGTPRTYNYTPEFPARLFYTGLELNLTPASRDTIKLFMNVEAPEPQLKRTPEILPTYKSIGEFYDGLQILLLQADGILNFLGRGVFQPDTVKKQLDGTAINKLFPIADPRAALKALRIIIEQGEGSSLGNDGSHWGFFKNIYDNYNLEYYDVVENLKSKDYMDEKFYPVMVACDAAYSFLLLTMERLWQTDDPDKRTALVNKNLRSSMSPVIGRLAKFLIKQQVTGSEKHVGPPFRRHEFTGNPLDDLSSARTVVETFVDLN